MDEMIEGSRLGLGATAGVLRSFAYYIKFANKRDMLYSKDNKAFHAAAFSGAPGKAYFLNQLNWKPLLQIMNTSKKSQDLYVMK